MSLKKFCFTTHQCTSTCAPFVARRTSNRQSISLHVFSNMCSVIVAKASVILAFKFVISGTGVENSLSLTYPHEKKSRGWYAVSRVSDHLSQSTCLEILHPKTDEHLNPSVEVRHLVGKLSTAERLLTEVQRKAPRSFRVVNVCDQGKTLCSLCILVFI